MRISTSIAEKCLPRAEHPTNLGKTRLGSTSDRVFAAHSQLHLARLSLLEYCAGSSLPRLPCANCYWSWLQLFPFRHVTPRILALTIWRGRTSSPHCASIKAFGWLRSMTSP